MTGTRERRLAAGLVAICGLSAAAVCAAVAQRLEASGFHALPVVWDALGVGAIAVTILNAGVMLMRSGR